MKKEQYKYIKLKLSQLIINKDNPRDLFKKMQNIQFIKESEIIKNMCINDDNYKMSVIIRSISDKGLLPHKNNFIVIKEFKNENKIHINNYKYKIIDGNRRIAALKIMNDPDLVSDPKIDLKLRKFVTQNQKQLNEIELNCIEYFKEEEAYDILEEEHIQTKQNKWDPISKILAAERYCGTKIDLWLKVWRQNKISDFNKKYIDINLTEYQQIKKKLSKSTFDDNMKLDVNNKFIEDSSKNNLMKIINDVIQKNPILDDPNYLQTIFNSNINENRNIFENEYLIGDLQHKNKKLENDDYYQGILKILKEIKLLKFLSTFDNDQSHKKQQLYTQLPIATLTLIRNIYEQLLKFYLKEYHPDIIEKFITKKNNNNITQIKLSNIINCINNKINTGQEIFNKTIDNKFKTFVQNKPFLDFITHQTYLFTGNKDLVKDFTSGYTYELFNFILNKN